MNVQIAVIKDKMKRLEQFFLSSVDVLKHTEPFKGHCGGKNSGWVEKNSGWEEKIFFKCFAFSRKPFAFPRETCVLSQNFAFSRKDICVPLAKLKKKKYLQEKAKVLRGNANIFARERKSFARERKVSRGNAKVLRENAKFLEGTQKFCERTQKHWKYFFLTPWIFSTHSDFFPPQCPLKGSVETWWDVRKSYPLF